MLFFVDDVCELTKTLVGSQNIIEISFHIVNVHPWSRGMTPSRDPVASGYETAEEECCLPLVTPFSQLATGEGGPPWTREDRIAIYLRHVNPRRHRGDAPHEFS